MNEYDIKRYALILAVQAEIEGMKAENTIRQNHGESLAYSENAFSEKAGRLEYLARCHFDLL